MIRSPPKKLSTPPPEQAPRSELSQTASHSSEPDLTSLGAKSDCPSITTRRRAKNLLVSEDLKTSINDLNKLLKSSMAKQDSKLAMVITTVNEIKHQNESIAKTVEFLSEENNDLKKRLLAMESERKDFLLYIKSLETKIENFERNSRCTGLELRNFVQKPDETKKDLSSLIMLMGNKINVPIQEQEIRDVFRPPSKAANRPIVVEFTSVIKKDEFLHSIKKFKQQRNGQLESTSFGIGGPPTKVFISETLTSKNKRLFTLARDLAKSEGFKYCWTAHGYVYLRRGDGQAAIRINAEEDLDRLRAAK